MKKKVSYCIDFGSLAKNQFEYYPTMDKLKVAIKKLLDMENKPSFELNVVFDYGFGIGKFKKQFAGYDHHFDIAIKFNLNKNSLSYKRLEWSRKSVWSILKSYGV